MGKKEREKYKEEILYLFTHQNKNLSTIAEELNLNRRDVKLVLKENNLYSETRCYLKNEPEAQKTIIHLYQNEKLSLREISEMLNRDIRAIKRVLVKHNIKLRHAGDYNRKYISNDYAFSQFTPESVYWAGFIAGDGCIYSHGLGDKNINNCLTVTLASLDKEHLNKLKEFLSYNGVLYESETKVALTVNNRQIVADLEEKYNISNNKTNSYIPPKNLPQHLIKYFILGLFDSDGCITRSKRTTKRQYKGSYVYQISFTGTKEVCEYIKNFFNSTVKIHKRRENSTNNYTVLFQGNPQIIKYLSQLYDDISINFCLKRKYQMYTELVEQYKE
jgi:predicted HTH domain antitoxin